MRVFVYEFASGGGFYTKPEWGEPAGSLLTEGLAMASSLATDFQSIEGVDVTLFADTRLPEIHSPSGAEVWPISSSSQHDQAMGQASAAGDWTLLIAPETAGVLEQLARRCEASGIRLLSPPSDFVGQMADKTNALRLLATHGISVPVGGRIECGEELPFVVTFPLVVKPNDGAGSDRICVVHDRSEWRRRAREYGSQPVRWESLCRGRAASIAVLGGVSGSVLLPPCYQTLDVEGDFGFLGGRLISEPSEARRCEIIAQRVATACGHPVGYWGIDLVLGNDPSGRDDYLIEVNPRLTTSYVGLRAALTGNLAEMILETAVGGRPAVRLERPGLEFDPTGELG